MEIRRCESEQNTLFAQLMSKQKELERAPWWQEPIWLKAEINRLWDLIEEWRYGEYVVRDELEFAKHQHQRTAPAPVETTATFRQPAMSESDSEKCRKQWEKLQLKQMVHQSTIARQEMEQKEERDKDELWRKGRTRSCGISEIFL